MAGLVFVAGVLAALSSCVAQAYKCGGALAVPAPLFFLLPGGKLVIPGICNPFNNSGPPATSYPPRAPQTEYYYRGPELPTVPRSMDADARLFPRPSSCPAVRDEPDLEEAYRWLVRKDDETIRRELTRLGRVLGGEMGRPTWHWEYRKVPLPDEFGARILQTAMPLLESKSAREQEDARFLLPMLLRLLEAMQCRPALDALMSPERSPETVGPDVWAAFGATAAAPLAGRARESTAPDLESCARRGGSLEAIARIRDSAALPSLQGLLHDPDAGIRAAADKALRGLRVR